MALPVYSLGNYRFVNFHRADDPSAPPSIVQFEADVISRKGVNGTGLLYTGRRGKPMPYRSKVDVATLAQAHALIDEYTDMIADDRFELVWKDISYSAYHECAFFVVGVEVTKIQQVACMTGGLSGATSGYWVEAEWLLVPVPIV